MLRTLLRWLVRLFFFGLIVGAVGFVVTRLLGGEDEDFEDFEDLESGFEFNETPVEIEVSEPVPAPTSTPSTSDTMTAQESHEAVTETDEQSARAASHSTGPMAPMTDTVMLSEIEEGADNNASGSAASTEETGTRLIDIKGIGPGYQERLHSMGITTLQELIDADPNQIAEELGVIGGASAVEDWTGQARSMLSEAGGQ